MKHPKYSVIMPVLLRENDHQIIVEQTIESVKENSEDYEFIIVDDGSPKPTGFLQDAADVFIKHDQTKGIAPSWNDGIKASKGDYIVIINDDIMMPSGWLKEMVNVLDEYEQAGVVGPWFAGPDKIPGCFGPMTTALGQECSYAKEDHVFFPGYCFMLKRNTFLEEFDEQFVPFNFEDTDMWWRIMKAGLKLYRAPVTIWHKEGDVLHKLQYNRVNTQNHQKFIDKWGFDPQPYFYGNKNINEIL